MDEYDARWYEKTSWEFDYPGNTIKANHELGTKGEGWNFCVECQEIVSLCVGFDYECTSCGGTFCQTCFDEKGYRSYLDYVKGIGKTPRGEGEGEEEDGTVLCSYCYEHVYIIRGKGGVDDAPKRSYIRGGWGRGNQDAKSYPELYFLGHPWFYDFQLTSKWLTNEKAREVIRCQCFMDVKRDVPRIHPCLDFMRTSECYCFDMDNFYPCCVCGEIQQKPCFGEVVQPGCIMEWWRMVICGDCFGGFVQNRYSKGGDQDKGCSAIIAGKLYWDAVREKFICGVCYQVICYVPIRYRKRGAWVYYSCLSDTCKDFKVVRYHLTDGDMDWLSCVKWSGHSLRRGERPKFKKTHKK